MNIKDKMILEEFKKERNNFIRLGEIVLAKLKETIAETDVVVTGIEHRVKSEKSLEVKLYKNGDYYQTMNDLRDLLGARIICCFSDDVYKIGESIEKKFDIFREYSADKRTLMKADSFGYLSLHYICALKKNEGFPPELVNKKFEIQIRTMLQHTWAVINHDLGYKNEFGVPDHVVREFARLAGLLELADNEFMRARDHIKEYTENVREKIIHDDADDVGIDLISLREYMLRNKKMREFLGDLAAIEGSEMTESNPDNYIHQLKWLGINSIGDLQDMLERSRDLALSFARRLLKGSELDILASNVALRFLCRAELLHRNYDEEKMLEFMRLASSNAEGAKRQLRRLLKIKKELEKNEQI